MAASMAAPPDNAAGTVMIDALETASDSNTLRQPPGSMPGPSIAASPATPLLATPLLAPSDAASPDATSFMPPPPDAVCADTSAPRADDGAPTPAPRRITAGVLLQPSWRRHATLPGSGRIFRGKNIMSFPNRNHLPPWRLCYAARASPA
jgi:hypothetical protein